MNQDHDSQETHDSPFRTPKVTQALNLLQAVWGAGGGATSSDGPLPERIGRFEILSKLGEGGFGIVYQAHDPQLQRMVALKVARSESMSDRLSRDRFLREARLAASLNHPNIVGIYEVGEYESNIYIATELCTSSDLGRRLRSTSELPGFRDSAQILISIAEAVEFAHRNGIIHRDLKPSNILLSADGTPKVADFGLAKQLEGNDAESRSGLIAGTASYMAPEQAMGSKVVGPAADIHALGAILYELLTGRPPYRAQSMLETLQLVLETQPVPVRRLNPQVPRDLETISLHCLKKNPASRYPSAGDLAADLTRYLNGQPISARPVSVLERTYLWAKAKPTLATLSLVVGLALLAILVGSWLFTARLNHINHDLTTSLSERNHYAEQLTQTNQQLQDEQNAIQISRAELAEQLAMSQFDRQDITRGMRHLLEALRYSPGDAKELQWRLRFQLAAWETSQHRLLSSEPASTSLLTRWYSDGRQLYLEQPLTRLASNRILYDAIVYDAKSQKALTPPLKHLHRIQDARFYAPFDRVVTVSGPTSKRITNPEDNDTVQIWNLKTGEPIGKPFREVHSIRFADLLDESTLLTVSSTHGEVVTWNIDTGKLIRKVCRHPSRISAVALSPDRKRIATAGMDQQVYLWDLASGKLALNGLPHPNFAQQLAFSSTGNYLATGCRDYAVRLWELTTGRLLGSPMWHPGSIRELQFDANDTKLIVNCEIATLMANAQAIRTWELHPEQWPITKLPHGAVASQVGFSADGRIAFTASGTGTAKLWDSRSGKLLKTIEHGHPITMAALSPDAKSIVIEQSGVGSVFIYPVEGADRPLSPIKHRSPLRKLLFRNNGAELLSADLGGAIIHTRLADQKNLPLASTITPNRFLYDICLSPDESTLSLVAAPFTDLKGTLEVYSLTNQTLVWPAVQLSSRSLRCAYCRGGQAIVTVHSGGVIELWDSVSGEKLQDAKGHLGGIDYLNVSPNGNWALTAGNDGLARLWNLNDLPNSNTVMRHSKVVTAIDFHPREQIVLTLEVNEGIRLWDFHGHQLGPMLALPGCRAAQFSPDGQQILANCLEGAVLLQMPQIREDLEQLSKQLDRILHLDGSKNSLLRTTPSAFNK